MYTVTLPRIANISLYLHHSLRLELILSQIKQSVALLSILIQIDVQVQTKNSQLSREWRQ
mgnify:FL=1